MKYWQCEVCGTIYEVKHVFCPHCAGLVIEKED